MRAHRGPTLGPSSPDSIAREAIDALASALRTQQAHLDEAVRNIERLADRVAGQLRQAATAAPIERLPTLQSKIIVRRHIATDAARGRLLEVAKPLRHRSREIAGLLGRMDEARVRLAIRRTQHREGSWRYDGRKVTNDQLRDAEIALAAARRDAAQPSTLLDAVG